MKKSATYSLEKYGIKLQYTHHYPEVLQILELAEVFLQPWVNGLVLYLGILQEGPKLLQSVQLT